MAKKDLIKLANDAGSDKPPKPIPDKIYDWVLHPENGFYVFNNLNIRTTFHNALITLEKKWFVFDDSFSSLDILSTMFREIP